MLFLAILTLLLRQVVVVSAQSAFASNATFSQSILNNSQLLLQYGPSSNNFTIALAADLSTGTLSNANTLQAIMLNGTIQLYGPFNQDQLTVGNFAYVACDLPAYTQGNIGFKQTIQQAVAGVTSSGTYPNYGAIVLYSETAQWCNYTATDGFNYTSVFVLPGRMQALTTEGALRGSSSPMRANIFNTNIVMNGTVWQPSSNNNNDSGASGPSTTVAMVILYSVTGIITICFVVVIVTGALRARRHPERYGLGPNGAPRRRARGIARAMLETIPIVKFGEREPTKASDIETGTEMGSVTDNTDKNTAMSPSSKVENTNDANAAVPSAADSSTLSPTSQADVPADLDISDNGLACSVCTDDFVKGQDLRVLPCNHKFHPECIDPWLLNVSGTCPLCRIDLRDPEDREQHVAEPTPIPEPPLQPGERQPGPPFHRYSLFLNRQRLARSTPAQRLRALRDLRNHRRNQTNSTSNSPTDNASSDTTRSPTDTPTTRSNRVSRFLGRRDGSPPATNDTTSSS